MMNYPGKIDILRWLPPSREDALAAGQVPGICPVRARCGGRSPVKDKKQNDAMKSPGRFPRRLHARRGYSSGLQDGYALYTFYHRVPFAFLNV